MYALNAHQQSVVHTVCIGLHEKNSGVHELHITT